ncbi:hypothetical protein [Chondromyces crocatus]|uniref:Uncharacterized protein n=1 Tax=Chondromyces crocatus TaxID=52 RepID=A0A0K1E9U6_CHOCO|nr:hypothetical protein [Chondromyces crocatus]AKT37646.1 uncharacterized protein CMC5_017880 [Chondromyces crocatus]
MLDRAPAFDEEVIWYGPFEGPSPVPVVITAFFLLVVVLLWLVAEHDVLHAFECTRGGSCVVTWGSELVPQRRVERFDLGVLETAEVIRTREKHPKTALVITLPQGKLLRLASGPMAHELHREIRAFVDEPARTTLTVAEDVGSKSSMRVVVAGVVIAGVLTMGWFALERRKRRIRVRVVLAPARDVCEIHRSGWLHLSRMQTIPLSLLLGAQDVSTSGKHVVVLETSEGADIPLTSWLLPADEAHARFVEQLQVDLAKLRGESRGPEPA